MEPDDFYKGKIADDICFDLNKGGSKYHKMILPHINQNLLSLFLLIIKEKIYTAGENSGGMRLKDTFD